MTDDVGRLADFTVVIAPQPRGPGSLTGGLGRNWNEHRRRFIWHKSADQILE